MKSTRVIHKRTSHKTLWFGLLGAIVVIVGSILFGYAQGQKKEIEKMNPNKPVPSDAELRSRLARIAITFPPLKGGAPVSIS